MKISTVLDHIDNGHMALPEFQRGYVWNRDQVRGLMTSLYRRHPVGSLLVWATESREAQHRSDQQLAAGIVKLLLDGQQRITSLYGIIRGKPPAFFDGNTNAFTGLYFHLEREEFSFYMPTKMQGDPLWIDVTQLMQIGLGGFITAISQNPDLAPKLETYLNRLNQIQGIKDIDIHLEEVTGGDKTIDVVVDIFNRVNSGGTKLSKGDLALAKICAEWPQAREHMKAKLAEWEDAGYHFTLDWLLRNVNTVATGEALFTALHNVSNEEFQQALAQTERVLDYLLNVIDGRLGLDHDRVLFGRYALPVMANYVARRGGRLDNEQEVNTLLYWYLHSALWGRFSGSTETVINKDLELIAGPANDLERLIQELKLWRGNLRVLPEHFTGWSLGARFYPMLYLLTRTGEARDWGNGIPLKNGLLGKMSRLEVHHIFPRSLLYKAGYKKSQVNAVANFCFLTKDTNLDIRDKTPEVYLAEVAERFPGALESQWLPMDRSLWRIENYLEFLEARRKLLADAANALLDNLYRVAAEPEQPAIVVAQQAIMVQPTVRGGIDSQEEERLLEECMAWMRQYGLPEGESSYELVDPLTGAPHTILDLAWPEGLQAGYSQPVVLLIDEPNETLLSASQAGFKCFEDVASLKRYVIAEILHHDLLAMTDPGVHGLLLDKLDQSWPLPEVGYEFQGPQGEILAEAELAWPDRKTAIVLHRNPQIESVFRTMGWQVSVAPSANTLGEQVRSTA